MEIILLETINKVGSKHEVVKVKPGFGRNYLIPQGLAIIANSTNKAKLDDLRAKEAEVEAQKVGQYQQLASKLEGITLTIGVKAASTGKIFGSVTGVQIAAAIKEHLGIEVERRKIHIPEEVKEVGEYKAEVHFYEGIHPVVNINVVAE
jgi:large subunit ribosomal protein L9